MGWNYLTGYFSDDTTLDPGTDASKTKEGVKTGANSTELTYYTSGTPEVTKAVNAQNPVADNPVFKLIRCAVYGNAFAPFTDDIKEYMVKAICGIILLESSPQFSLDPNHPGGYTGLGGIGENEWYTASMGEHFACSTDRPSNNFPAENDWAHDSSHYAYDCFNPIAHIVNIAWILRNKSSEAGLHTDVGTGVKMHPERYGGSAAGYYAIVVKNYNYAGDNSTSGIGDPNYLANVQSRITNACAGKDLIDPITQTLNFAALCNLFKEGGVGNKFTASRPELTEMLKTFGTYTEDGVVKFTFGKWRYNICGNIALAAGFRDMRKLEYTDTTAAWKADAERGVYYNTEKDAINPNAKGVVSFNSFLTGIGFLNMMKLTMGASFYGSLYSYLQKFILRFFHEIMIVPTMPYLRGNLPQIIIKPELLTSKTPYFNYIYAPMILNMNVSRSYKAEPTRALLITDPMKIFTGQDSSPVTTILTSVGMYNNVDSKNIREYGEHIGTNNQKGWEKQPFNYLTNYEAEHGVRPYKISNGAEIYLYMKSGGSTITVNNVTGRAQGTTPSIKLKDASDEAGVGEVLSKLAGYELMRARLMARQGSLQTTFNPYIIPGFTCCASVGDQGNENMSYIRGYVTEVSHTLPAAQAPTTSIQLKAISFSSDSIEQVYPIIDDNYNDNIGSIFADMSGKNVGEANTFTSTSSASAIKSTDGIARTSASVGLDLNKAYTAAHRVLPSLDDYLTFMYGKGTYKMVTDNDGVEVVKLNNGADYVYTDVLALQRKLRSAQELDTKIDSTTKAVIQYVANLNKGQAGSRQDLE